MTNRFEIEINGIALCYYKDPFWNVVFPCNSDHRAASFCGNAVLGDLWQAGRTITIDFPVASILPPASHLGICEVPLFNLSGSYAHGTVIEDDGTVASPLMLNDLSLANKHDYVWLRIPHAVMSSNTPGDRLYYVQELTKGPGLPPRILSRFARRVTLEFTAISPIKMVAKDARDPSYSREILSPLPEAPLGGVCTMAIDNDCHVGCDERNDFMDLYTIVQDTNNRQFAAGQISPESVVGTADVVAYTSTYGNCDPVWGDPPPGP
jgi:hypothetical protein